MLPVTDERPESETAESRREATKTASATILLVEDEEQVRNLFRKVLQRAGYLTLECDTGEAALDLRERHAGEIDLLVTDIMMPGINGFELVNRLRELNPGLRVLFMSGYSAERLKDQSEPGEHTRFLQKPFLPGEFLEAIRDLLGRRDA